jgi:hypothetical protein
MTQNFNSATKELENLKTEQKIQEEKLEKLKGENEELKSQMASAICEKSELVSTCASLREEVEKMKADKVSE